MEVMEASTVSPHLLLLGGFNAHLGQTREPQTHQFKQLLERFPQLSTPRLNQTQHTRLNTAGQCLLDLVASIPIIISNDSLRLGAGKEMWVKPLSLDIPVLPLLLERICGHDS